MKKCWRCKLELPLEAFNKDRKAKDGKQTCCRKCGCEMVENRRQAKKLANLEEFRRSEKDVQLRHKYGISLADYEAMLEKQNHCCALCFKPLGAEPGDGKRPPVDHCHKTGKVVAILHRKCNIGLGHWDTPEEFLLAAEYKKRHSPG